ncbi:N/A [soil metagenome]
MRRLRLCIVMPRPEGHGGVPRTVINLANGLVEEHDVEIIGLLRWRNQPVFPIDPRVQVRYVQDLRPYGPKGGRRDITRGGVDEHGRPVTRESVLAQQKPSAYVPFDHIHWESNDQPLIEALRTVGAELIVGTTPALNGLIVEHVPAAVATVGQDHSIFQVRTRTPEQRAWLRRAIDGLDAFVSLTGADARDYRAMMPGSDTLITAIPNAVSWPVAPVPAPLERPVVVAAGRLDAHKGFDRLIDAYAPIAEKRPDWRLDIYGSGSLRSQLQAQIDRLGIGGRVALQGFTRELPSVLAQSSVYALTSHSEGFPMVLLEAMSTGLPLVSYDCPRGPADLVRDGVNGRLVPDGEQQALTDALLQVIDDEPLRRSMGKRAWLDAHAYELPVITQRWNDVFEQVLAGRR